MRNQTYVEVLVPQECCSCHITFAMTKATDRAFRKNRNSFSCPMGHWQSYVDESEEAKLRRRLELSETQKDYWRREQERTERRRRAAVGQVTKIKKRVGKGVCPCCNRTFSNLTRHMETEHPDYGDGPTEAT